MRRWLAVPALSAAVVALALCPAPPRVAAQNLPSEETFLTADGIQLRGLFHRSEKNPSSDPVVILMYAPGPGRDMNKGDWKGLAERLTKEGYNVFRFDWRGHGKSTDIKDTAKFWNLATPQMLNPNPFTGPWNTKLITGAPVGKTNKIKNEFFYKDLRSAERYIPAYLLDLAAVRYHLDNKNDSGDVNTSSIYLIGAESAAGIGIAWMATEWHRPAAAPTPNQLAPLPTYQYVPQPLNGGIPLEAATDISAAIWLSPARPTAFPEPLIKSWLSKYSPKMRENNPMLFLHGDKDAKGKAGAEFYFNDVLVANPSRGSTLQRLTQTFLTPIKEAGTLSGADLLGNNDKLKTEKTILDYMTAIQKERAKLIRKNRGFTSPYAISLTSFGIPAP